MAADTSTRRANSVRYDITFNISGGNFAQLNAAVEAVHTIERRLTAMGDQGSPALAEALDEITQPIIDEATLSPERRAELTDNADDLTEAAAVAAGAKEARQGESSNPGNLRGGRSGNAVA